MGVFGATFQSSLSQGQSDQARYRVGGDMVMRGASIPANAEERLETIPGVTAVSPVLRDSVRLLDGPVGANVEKLAVEPRSMAEAAWFREDFFPGGLEEITRLLRSRPLAADLTGIPLPEGTESLGVWVDSSSLAELDLPVDVNMWARLITATGRYRNVSMGTILGPETRGTSDSVASDGPWRLFTGDLPEVAPELLPFELVSIFFSTAPFARLSDGVLYLDDITASGPLDGPDRSVIEGFESLAPWAPLANQGQTSDAVQRTAESAGTGN